MVLHPEHWKGQEYGSGTEAVVHSRHLRTLCDRFSTGKKQKSLGATETLFLWRVADTG